MGVKENSIFSQIIEGKIPSHKLYEDEFVFSFLDVNPQSPGHALVVPKEPLGVELGLLTDDFLTKVLFAEAAPVPATS